MGIFKYIPKKDGYHAELVECSSSVLVFPSCYSDGSPISKISLAKHIPGEADVKKIIIESGLQNICKFTGRFRACEEIVVGEGVEKIPSECFKHMYSLKVVRLPSSVEVIEEKAFFCSRLLEKVIIPTATSLKYIYSNAFGSPEAFVNKCMLAHCNKYKNGYYLPSGDNPYFCLLHIEDDFDFTMHGNCEMIYDIDRSHFIDDNSLTLNDLIKCIENQPHLLKVNNECLWSVENGMLKASGRNIASLNESIQIKYQMFHSDDRKFNPKLVGLRGWIYYLNNRKFNFSRSDAKVVVMRGEKAIEIATVDIVSNASLFNMITKLIYP